MLKWAILFEDYLCILESCKNAILTTLLVLKCSNDVFWNLEVQIPLVRQLNHLSSTIVSQVMEFYM